jgi:hypothetical protein
MIDLFNNFNLLLYAQAMNEGGGRGMELKECEEGRKEIDGASNCLY